MRRWLFKHRYVLARRGVQLAVLALFIAAPGWFMGDLSASRVFGIPLADPLAALQILLANGHLASALAAGAAVVAGVYALLGRAFCGWVCPVNLLTQSAQSLRLRLLGGAACGKFPRRARYLVLAAVLALAAAAGAPVYEAAAPYGLLGRGIIYAQLGALAIALAVFALELAAGSVVCRICPLGALFAIIARFAPLRVIYSLEACTRCGKCQKICPEAPVLGLIGRHSGAVASGECIRCGACVEACDDGALGFKIINLVKEKNEKTSSF